MNEIDRNQLKTLFLADLSLEDLEAPVTDVFGEACSYPSGFNIHVYAAMRQAEAFSSKAQETDDVPASLKEAAISQLLDIEHDNHQFDARTDFDSLPGIEEVRHRISQVLPPLSLVEDQMWSLCKFGQGATFGQGGPMGRHTLAKIGGSQTVTARAFGLVTEVLTKHYPSWLGGSVWAGKCTFAKGNRLEFVPKDIHKCRTIAVEPSLNMFLQLGVGNWLFRRLRKFGIDLTDQIGNRLAARKGSTGEDGGACTIDLSDASSRISRGLVKALLPSDWFQLLDTLRSPGYVIDGKYHSYRMFMSQGNAFTFPLETLVFWAITTSTTSGVKVYGDDIIVPLNAGKRAVERLEAYGLKVNISKSFLSGPFRESCGADYLDGIFVRPIYYKRKAERYSEIAMLHNLLYSRWGYLPLTCSYLQSLVPVLHRNFGPFGYWRSDEVNPMENTISVALSEYFWYPPGLSPIEPSFRQHRWLVRSRCPKWVRRFDEATLRSNFLYTGRSDVMSSDLVKHYSKSEVFELERCVFEVPRYSELILNRSFSELLLALRS